MPDPYLVLFVVDPAADEHAEAFGDLAATVSQLHRWEGPEPRAFDAVPSRSEERTVGIALRIPRRPVRDAPAIAALVESCATVADGLGVALEVQLEEVVLGELRAGVVEESVVVALRERLGVELN
ncbi:MAG TPA: hypothetical protein VD931_11945 [Baekduia sp.]|nr:hypothetical protein [Baekduia sp.]